MRHALRSGLVALLALLVVTPPIGAEPGDVFSAATPSFDSPKPETSQFEAGDHSVSEKNGAATYSYPIVVPPGRGGMQPALALTYSSQGPLRGGIAAGWTLETPSIRLDTSRGTLLSGRGFTVELGGAVGALVAVSPEFSVANFEWRAELDTSFTRFIHTPGTHPWTAFSTDGTIHFFGEGPESTDGLTRWHLSRQIDPYGNEIVYVWTPVVDEGETVDYSLSRIEYTSNLATGQSAHAMVSFSYSGPDKCGSAIVGARHDWHGGRRNAEGAKTLTAITTYVRDEPGADWRPVREVRLAYDLAARSCSGTASPLRVLTEIAVTGFHMQDIERTTSLPPLRFAYGAAGRTLEHRTVIAEPPPHRGNAGELGHTLLDIDGDGLQDAVSTRMQRVEGADECQLTWRKGRFGGGFATEEQYATLPTLPWAEGDTAGVNERCTLRGQYTKRTAGPPGGDSATCGGTIGSYNVYHFDDVDGDGRVDVMTGILADPWWYEPECDPALDEAGLNPTCEIARPCPRLEPGGDPNEPPSPAGECKRNRLPQHCKTATGDHFVWRLYANTLVQGLPAFEPMASFPTLVAVPIEAEGVDSAMGFGRGSLTTSKHAVVDIDGDRRVDAILGPRTAHPDSWRVYPGDGQGGFAGPFDWALPDPANVDVTGQSFQPSTTNTTPSSCLGSSEYFTTTFAGLRDVNADGLMDYLARGSDDIFKAFMNTGSGFADQGVPLGTFFGLDRSRVQIDDCQAFFGVRTFEHRMADVDADGLVDLVEISPPTEPDTVAPTVRLNAGDRFLPPVAIPDGLRWAPLERRIKREGATWSVTTDYSDVDGDGRGDVVFPLPSDEFEVYHDDAHEPARLLTTVTNGRGLTISYRYAPSTDPAVVTQRQDSTLPTITWVVSDVTVDPGFGSWPSTTRYSYEDPVYGPMTGDADDPSRFLGFRRVTSVLPIAAGQTIPGRVVRDFSYDNTTADGLGRLIREWTFSATNLVFYKEITWRREPLFEGRVTFTHEDVTLTRTCLGGPPPADAHCPTQSQNVKRETETWEPVEDPYGRVALYLRTGEQEGSGLAVGIDDRRSTFDYEVRGIGLLGLPGGYRVLPILEEREEARAGTGAELTFVLRGRQETEYDDLGSPVRSTEWKDAVTPAITSRTFDRDTGNVLSVTKPMQQGSGLRTTYLYDAHRIFVARTENELEHVTFTRTDPGTGNQIQRAGPNFKTDPNACDICFPLLYEAEVWRFDGLGRDIEHFVSVDDPLLAYRLELVERSTYEDFRFLETAEKTQRIDERRRDFGSDFFLTALSKYDGSGRLVQESRLRFRPGQPDETVAYAYDGPGNLISVTGPDPRYDDGRTITTSFRYDAIGRATSLTRPDGTVVTVSHAGLDNTIVEQTPDNSGAITVATYDVFGQLGAVLERDAVAGDALTTYVYDASGNLVRVTDADGVITNLDHDFAGNRSEIRRASRTWRYEYDLNDNLISEIDGPAATQTTSWAFDALDRVERRLPANNGLSPQRQLELGIGPVTHEYDTGRPNGIGRLARVTLPYGTIEYAHEARGLVTHERRSFAIPQPAISGSAEVARTFNALGLPTSNTWDGGQTWRTIYDERGLVAAVEWLDPSSLQYRRVAANETSLAGQVRRRMTDFAQEAMFQYDILGRREQHQVRKADGTVLAERTAAFTGAGDLRSLDATSGSARARFTYAYDQRHRLSSASAPELGYSSLLTYSKAGNIATANVAWTGAPAPRNVRYDYGSVDPHAVDRLVSLTNGATFASFEYDAPGNVLRRDTSLGSWTFDWDGEDQLREERGPGGTEKYHYDHDYQRALAVSSGPIRVRFWFGDSEIHYGSNGRVDVRYLHISDGNQPLARLELAGSSSAIELQHTDHVGSLILAASDTGVPTASFLYGAFGEVLAHEGAADHRRQFNGKEQDAKTGLGYYGFRFYDPLTFRWASADPVFRFSPELGLDNPANLNLYAFSFNNPLRFYDPLGLKVVLSSGDVKQFTKQYLEAEAYLKNAGTGVLEELDKLKETIEIKETSGQSMFVPGSNVILWNPTLGGVNLDDAMRSPALILLHEAAHAVANVLDPRAYEARTSIKDPNWTDAEEKRVITGPEKQAAIALGEPVRQGHRAKGYRKAKSVTEHTPTVHAASPKKATPKKQKQRPPRQGDQKTRKKPSTSKDSYIDNSAWCVTADCTLQGAK